MHIKMVGIDHSKASLQYREAFSFTKIGSREAVKEIKTRFNVGGCILLSTCNRTELWVSQWDDEKLNRINPYDMLCQIKNIDRSLYEEYFTVREDGQAVDHLLKVVCGFDSKIFGEDQIISQVREALQMSRECQCADMTLEKVFQTALAAGKRVKTEIQVSTVNPSTANDVIRILKSEVGNIKDLKCLVIGNGQMGKLVANTMVANGVEVSMTLRRKLHGNDEQESIMPERCKMVPYDDRISQLENCDIIVSATLSPHYTLKCEDVLSKFEDGLGKLNKNCYMFDLAVPRDIDPKIGAFPYVKLFDIDSMNTDEMNEEKQEQIILARSILQEYKDELSKWFKFRGYVPKIREIVKLVSEDTVQRFVSKVEDNKKPTYIAEAAKESAGKATSKLIYGLKEQLPPELWEQCLEALHRSAEKDTLKH